MTSNDQKPNGHEVESQTSAKRPWQKPVLQRISLNDALKGPANSVPDGTKPQDQS